MAKAWSNPERMTYDGVHLNVEGIDIREELKNCITAHNGPNPDYTYIGNELGRASRLLISDNTVNHQDDTVDYTS